MKGKSGDTVIQYQFISLLWYQTYEISLQVLNYRTLAIYLVTMLFSKLRLKINCSVQRQLQRKKLKLIATD